MKMNWKANTAVVDNVEIIVGYNFEIDGKIERRFNFDEIKDFEAPSHIVANHYFSFGFRQSFANTYAGWQKKLTLKSDILSTLDEKWDDVKSGIVTRRRVAESKVKESDLLAKYNEMSDGPEKLATAKFLEMMGIMV